jgi:hypothetical protein
MKIVYIDEEQDERSRFERMVHLSEYLKGATVATIEPDAEISDTIAEIDSHKPDVVVTDYRLNEHKAGIGYTGSDLIKRYLRLHRHFPCFVTTSYPIAAAEVADELADVAFIYSKNESLEPEDNNQAQTLPFSLRMKTKVQTYKNNLETIQQKIDELCRKVSLTPLENIELLRLDSELEAFLGEPTKIPDHIKQLALKPVTTLVSKAEQALLQIEKLFANRNAEN